MINFTQITLSSVSIIDWRVSNAYLLNVYSCVCVYRLKVLFSLHVGPCFRIHVVCKFPLLDMPFRRPWKVYLTYSSNFFLNYFAHRNTMIKSIWKFPENVFCVSSVLSLYKKISLEIQYKNHKFLKLILIWK